MSGFLIGGILLKAAKTKSGMVAFYIKRILRIWPLYYLLLGWVCLLGGGLNVFADIPIWSFVAFIFNYWEVQARNIHDAFSILWSLAIEEQFYLLAPLAFFAFKPKVLMYLAASCILATPLLRLALAHTGILDLWRFTPTRLDGISMGVFLSIALASPDTVSFLSDRIRELKLATLLSFAATLYCRIVFSDYMWHLFGTSLIVVFFGLLLTTALMYSWSIQSNRVLNSAVLRYLGIRCYSIYLFHIFFMIAARSLVEDFWIGLLAQSVLTLGFAHLAWEYIEAPLITYGRRFSYD